MQSNHQTGMTDSTQGTQSWHECNTGYTNTKMSNYISQEIQRYDLKQMELIRKVSPNFTHELSVSRIQLLFEWLEALRSSEELPLDDSCMVAGPRSNLASKSAWACQKTLRECPVNCSGLHERRRKGSLSQNRGDRKLSPVS